VDGAKFQGLALDFQDGISYPAAKPRWMEPSFEGLALDFQDGISYPVAKPRWMEPSFRDWLLIFKTVSHIRPRSRVEAPLHNFSERISRAKAQSAAALPTVFFAPLRLCGKNFALTESAKVISVLFVQSLFKI